MGHSRHDADTWTSYTSNPTASRSATFATAKSTADLLTSTKIDDKMSPVNIKIREARDSALNPKSLPIILALDCTGSMNAVIFEAIKKFNLILEELIAKSSIEDPAIMTMFLDDVIYVGSDALQVSQFESDIEAVKQFEKMYVTGHGGGNSSESYHLPLYMAAFKTKTDSMEKRNKKGYLFTVGDEEMPPKLTKGQIQQVFGPDEPVSQDFTYMDLWEAASRSYHCFHIVVMQGSHAGSAGEKHMREAWNKIGQGLIILDDLTALPEVVVSTIRINEGEELDKVVGSWTGTTAVTVRAATAHLAKTGGSASTSTGPGVATV